MAAKFYVVWVGRKVGVFNDWDTCKKQVDAFAGAKYKSFQTKSEAELAFGGGVNRSDTVGKGQLPSKRNTSLARKSIVKTHSSSEVDAFIADVKIFTDGGCEPNPGKAGSGLALYRENRLSELWYGLFNPNGTNNTAELNSLHQAMLMAVTEIEQKKKVVIFCDSKYSIQCITQWAASWQKKGWKKSGGEIKNLDLIKEMFALYQQLKGLIQILHVNGHVGVEGNEMADRMSILAIEERQELFVRFEKSLNVDSILAMKRG